MKDIPGYEGRYAITQNGQIWSYISEKFLKPKIDKYGYKKVQLYNGTGKKESKTITIHQLVALTYIPNPNPNCLTTVDHIDQNKNNNHVSNLRWADMYIQNHNQQLPAGKSGGIKVSKAVEQRDITYHEKLIATYPSSMAASEALFGDTSKNSLINRCANGKKKSAYGYWWCFVGDYHN